MPVYEQKLISPLALRFTQEHIRTSFQDGRIVEDSIEDITVRPAAAGSDYDLILKAPFPAIEILRWRHGGSASDSAEHWFTLDNRRLYCLQRAAMAHWPSRVAAEVDILYADHGRVFRKYDSTTFGVSVSIGHSCHGPEVDFWDWSMEAEASTTVSDISAAASFSAAQRDDQRATVDDLTNDEEDHSGPLSSSILRLLQMEAQTKEERLVTPSTSTTGSEDCDSVDEVLSFEVSALDVSSEEEVEATEIEVESDSDLFAATDKYIARGSWLGEKGETYTICPNSKGQGDWTCSRQDVNGASKSFTLFYDWDYDLIWWGTTGAYFASASELVENCSDIHWYGSKDLHMRKPKFSWHMQEVPVHKKTDGIAEHAIMEIMESLTDPENSQGHVWVSGWNERYGRRGLGQLKAFLEQHPDKFLVTSLRGKAFRATLVEAESSAKRFTNDRGKRKMNK